jgi:hypothetical protein
MLLSPAPDVNKLSATDGNIIPGLKIFKNFRDKSPPCTNAETRKETNHRAEKFLKA